MKPAPSEKAELLHRVRQQLILAQVRIMELEDIRDELAPRLATCEKLRMEAQQMADQKLEEAGHLEKMRGGLQAQYEHLRHMQHITNEALNQSRQDAAVLSASLAATTLRADGAEQRGHQLRNEITTLTGRLEQLKAHGELVRQQLADSQSIAATRLERINQLDGENRALKVSRSWRWTAWLRSIERAWGGRRP